MIRFRLKINGFRAENTQIASNAAFECVRWIDRSFEIRHLSGSYLTLTTCALPNPFAKFPSRSHYLSVT